MHIIKLLKAFCLACLLSASGQLHAGLLYTINEATDRLVSIDTQTLVLTDVGLLGRAFFNGGLAYDPNSDVLYGIDGQNGPGITKSLFQIDRVTGAATDIGVHGLADLAGLAFDSTNNLLYATQFVGNSNGADLVTLDTSTGTATKVADIINYPFRLNGLTYDVLHDRLVGTHSTAGIFEVNRADASLTLLRSFLTEGEQAAGFAYDSDANLFWGVDSFGKLISYDPANSFARTIHLTGLPGQGSLAYVSTASVPEPSSICLLSCGLVFLAFGERRRRRM